MTPVRALESVPSARILVVDDEPRQRASLAELVAMRGFRVEIASDAANAIEQLEQGGFDLILVDLHMPGMDGHQLLAHLRERNLDVAAIALSGDPSSEDATRALRAGADDYLRKPYSPEQIYAAIEQSLGKRAQAAAARRARRRLEFSEQLHRLIVNHSPDLMIILDAQKRFRFVNEAADFVLGYRPDSLIGKPFESLLEKADHERVHELLDLHPDKPELRSAEMRLRPRRVGVRARMFELLAMPLGFDQDHHALPVEEGQRQAGCFIVARDVSDRLRTELNIRESERRYQELAELAADGFWETDPQGRISLISDSVSDIVGFSAESLRGRDLFAQVEGLGGAGAAAHELRVAIDEQVPFEVQLGGLGPSHPADAVVIAGRPRFDRDGRFKGFRGVFRDVSETYRQLAQAGQQGERMRTLVRERTHELEILRRELESFSFAVSHDLRSPLRAITGFGSMLLQEYGEALEGRAHEYLHRIVRAGSRMSQLIDELLRLSRVTRQSIQRQEVDLSQLALELDNHFRAANPGRKVLFDLARPMRVDGDPALLRVVLHELLDNAWKFTAGRDTARVSVGERLIDGQRTFYVEDNGEGFDPQHTANLFGAFQRLHADEQFPGHGVGLATAARIVFRHGGRIWAEGRPMAGATIFFTLPDRAEAAAMAGRERTAAKPSRRRGNPQKEPGQGEAED